MSFMDKNYNVKNMNLERGELVTKSNRYENLRWINNQFSFANVCDILRDAKII
jgi:hypothetical protein